MDGPPRIVLIFIFPSAPAVSITYEAAAVLIRDLDLQLCFIGFGAERHRRDCRQYRYRSPRPLASLDDGKWDHAFDIDLKGIFRVARPAVAGVRARKKGAIICLSSIMGVAYGSDEHVHYSAAKAGVVGPRPRPRGRIGERRRSRERCGARLHPHRAAP